MNGTGAAVVVGGGLAGLAAAVELARAGVPVTLVEKARAPGGRAVTEDVAGGYRLNLGPHALYRGGPAARALAALGIAPAGGVPSARGLFAWDAGRLAVLPSGALSFLRTRLLGAGAKLEAAALLARIGAVDAAALDDTTVSAWVERAARRPSVRALLHALVRVATYANDPGRMSAGAAVRQLQLVTRHSVLYLDGGWQVLVEALRTAALAAGARILTGARAVRVAPGRTVTLEDGTALPAAAAILATPPAEAAALTGSATLQAWAADALPVRAACLTVALSRLPVPGRLFALGIDRPLYVSVHSATARLAPEGGALIHAAHYLGDAPAPDGAGELESLLDALQPGWRDVLVERRFLPHLTVTHALVRADRAGLAGRPGPAVPGLPGVFVAGDWVGPEGMLADTALSSARAAAALAAEVASKQAAAPSLLAASGRREVTMALPEAP